MGPATRECPALAVTARLRNTHRIVSLTRTARQAGLRCGEALADARARVPELLAEEADPVAELKLLHAIADWCDRYTPLVALDGADGLFLDITGCAHLFGGEESLLIDVLKRIEAQGFAVRGAVADTPGAAWAASHFGKGGIVPPGRQAECLSSLPVAALRIAPPIVEDLIRVGLMRIADVLNRPRAPLVARYGSDLVQRLDQVLGRQGEPISPRFQVPHVVAERHFAEPIGFMEDVEAVIFSLARQLEDALERRVQGGRLFELTLFRADGAVQKIAAGASRPLRDPRRIVALFREKLKTDETVLDTGYGYDLMRLAVLETQEREPEQEGLARTDQRTQDEDFAGLLDRLSARLGPSHVTRLQPADWHVPESQSVSVPALSVPSRTTAWADVMTGALPSGQSFKSVPEALPLTRPLRLFSPPEPVDVVAMVPDGPPLRFRWRRALYEIVRSEGPERIAPPWWVEAKDRRENASSNEIRDYFRIEDENGRRFWLFRQGFYDVETGPPCWFIQGLFP